MRFFELVNLRHFILYLFPALITLFLFAVGLHFTYFRSRDSETRLSRIIHRFPLGIEERNAPFPLFLILVIMGTVIWGFGYILMIGLLEMRF